MVAVESPVEALGTAVSDGAWLWASGLSHFPLFVRNDRPFIVYK
jgi:hypothetical protein